MDATPPLFARKPLADLAALGDRRVFVRKDVLIREGDSGDSLFVLLEGRVRIFTADEEGRRFVFGIVGSGAIFGEGALDGGPRTASVEAVSDGSCAAVPYALISQRITNDAQFALILINELIARSRSSTGRMKSLALETVYQRLCKLLVQEGSLRNGVQILGAEWTQQAIANQIGSSRDMVTRIFRELVKGNYIATQRGETQVLRPLPKGW